MDLAEFDKIENQVSQVVFNICLQIHRDLGPGLFESVYEEVLFCELSDWGYVLERQKKVSINYKHIQFNKAFKADIIIANAVILEVKSVESVSNLHKMQLKTYLKLTGLKLGMLINFNVDLMKNGITRVVNGL
jgi:GxxExxY protein